MRVVGDVARHETATTCVCERLAHDPVDLEYRLRIESALRIRTSRGKQLRVEGFEVFDAQPTKRDVSDARDDMELEDARIAIPRTRAKVEALGGEPLLAQVARHRQSAVAGAWRSRGGKATRESCG